MAAVSSLRYMLTLDGIVQDVDAARRHLRVLVHGVPKEFVVPRDCLIRLDRLRLELAEVHLRDRVRIRCLASSGKLLAQAINVYDLPWQARRRPAG